MSTHLHAAVVDDDDDPLAGVSFDELEQAIAQSGAEAHAAT